MYSVKTGICAITALLGVLLNAPAALAAGILDTLPRIKASVMAVGSLHPTRTPRFKFSGTGFVVGDGLTVATNAHVLPKDLDSEHKEALVVVVQRGDQVKVHSARLVDSDEEHDLALLKIAGEPFPALRLGEPDRVREGQSLYITGYPLGTALGLHPATHHAGLAAIVPIFNPPSRVRKLNPKLIRKAQDPFLIFQLDAVAYPGNSGSPLYDPDSGMVHGIINSVFVKDSKESALTNPSGISYAIPVRYLRELLESNGIRP